jgi:hypothetical protein
MHRRVSPSTGMHDLWAFQQGWIHQAARSSHNFSMDLVENSFGTVTIDSHLSGKMTVVAGNPHHAGHNSLRHPRFVLVASPILDSVFKPSVFEIGSFCDYPTYSKVD